MHKVQLVVGTKSAVDTYQNEIEPAQVFLWL
jgi:hypothetical protein